MRFRSPPRGPPPPHAAPALEPVLHAKQASDCRRVREVREYDVSPARLQIGHRIATGRHANALRTNRTRRMHIAGCIADHDYATAREWHTELLRTALGPQANHLWPFFGITTK